MASAGEVFNALGLEAGEDFIGPADDLVGQPCETRDVDPIRGRLSARLNTMEEHDLACHLLDSSLVVLAAGQYLCQTRELVIMRGEERQRLHVEERSEERRVGKECRSR